MRYYYKNHPTEPILQLSVSGRCTCDQGMQPSWQENQEFRKTYFYKLDKNQDLSYFVKCGRGEQINDFYVVYQTLQLGSFVLKH